MPNTESNQTNNNYSLVNTSIELRIYLTQSRYNLNELRRIYVATPISDYFEPAPSSESFDYSYNLKPQKKLNQKKFFI